MMFSKDQAMNTAANQATSLPNNIMAWFKTQNPTMQALVITGVVFVALILFVIIFKLAAPPKVVPQARPRWEQPVAPAIDANIIELKAREAALLKEREKQQQQVMDQMRQEIVELRQQLGDTRTSLTGVHERVLILEARRGRVQIIRPGDTIQHQGYIESPRQTPSAPPQKVLATVSGRTWIEPKEANDVQQPDKQTQGQGTIASAER
jgi:hypothetical protein